MKTVKIKFVGKYAEDLQPKDNAITYYLQKNGYDVQISDDADYIICDVFDPKYDYCKYPQIRIFECGENYVPDFNLIDYAVCRYPVSFGDRCFYQPGVRTPVRIGMLWRKRNVIMIWILSIKRNTLQT